MLDAGGTCTKGRNGACDRQFADGVGTKAQFSAGREQDANGVGVDPTTGNMYVNWGEPQWCDGETSVFREALPALLLIVVRVNRHTYSIRHANHSVCACSYIGEVRGHRIRMVTPGGTVTTVAGKRGDPQPDGYGAGVMPNAGPNAGNTCAGSATEAGT